MTYNGLKDEVLRKGQIMVDALRTIASGKKGYGSDVQGQKECQQIARQALREIGCL